MYKLIVTDIDGTLYRDDKRMGERDIKAVAEMKRLGVDMMLSSGRYYKGVLPIAEMLGLDNTYHIATNGMCFFNTSGDVRFTHLFDREDYGNLIRHLRKTSRSYVIINKDSLWYETEDRSCVETMIPNNGDVDFIKVDDALDIADPFQICAYYGTPEECRNILARDFDTIFGAVTYHVLIDYIPKGIDKFVALKQLLDEMKISPEEVIGVGDNDNDLPIIENVGLGISVANASDNLKNASDIVLERTNNENPIEEILERVIKKQ